FGDLLDRALRLGEHVENRQPQRRRDGPSDAGELFEQLGLEGAFLARIHVFNLVIEYCIVNANVVISLREMGNRHPHRSPAPNHAPPDMQSLVAANPIAGVRRDSAGGSGIGRERTNLVSRSETTTVTTCPSSPALRFPRPVPAGARRPRR